MKDYILVRKKRKSIGFFLTKENKLKIHAPLKMPVRVIEEILVNYKDWIETRVAEIKKNRQSGPKYAEGEEFPYLGKNYPLRFVEGLEEPVLLRDAICIDKRFEEEAEQALKFWYRQEAEKILVQRTLWYSSRLLLRHRRIKISNARTRWGSCSTSGSINLNWRLVMAPMQVIDLICVHELMHLNQMDHSKAFWKKVEELIPDYMKWEKWLKENNKALSF